VLFNIPLPISERYPPHAGLNANFSKYYEGPSITQHVHMTKNRRVFVMQCGFHAYMESWALVEDHPYYAIADEQGRFTLTDIPPGSYEIVVWHPYLREAATEAVTIQPMETTSLDVTIAAPTGRLYANQMVENPYTRYTITEEVQGSIVPTLEKQRY
jgi:hypothetical protein